MNKIRLMLATAGSLAPSVYAAELNDEFLSTRHSCREWEVKLSRIYAGLTWALSYVDTDLSKPECYTTVGYGDACTAALILAFTV